jgi:mono/diheme cytochrome c family protein
MMKSPIRVSILLVSMFVMALVFTSFSEPSNIGQDDKEWVVPESAKKMKNPTEATPADLKIGKNLYMQHCKSCHGSKGLGDGPKAAELDTPSGDFTTDKFQSQTDGSLFYKTKEGRDDMPSFKKKLSEDEDVWLIVNFMRTFAE